MIRTGGWIVKAEEPKKPKRRSKAIQAVPAIGLLDAVGVKCFDCKHKPDAR